MQIKKITVSQEQCISTGNFESKRVHFGVEAELSEGDNYNNAYDYLKNIVEEKLKAEYRDVKESENDEMEITLGEVYREKMINIFKILEKKGVKVE